MHIHRCRFSDTPVCIYMQIYVWIHALTYNFLPAFSLLASLPTYHSAGALIDRSECICVYRDVYMCAYTYIHISIYMYMLSYCIPYCMHAWADVCISVCLSVRRSACQFVHLSVCCLSVCRRIVGWAGRDVCKWVCRHYYCN